MVRATATTTTAAASSASPVPSPSTPSTVTARSTTRTRAQESRGVSRSPVSHLGTPSTPKGGRERPVPRIRPIDRIGRVRLAPHGPVALADARGPGGGQVVGLRGAETSVGLGEVGGWGLTGGVRLLLGLRLGGRLSCQAAGASRGLDRGHWGAIARQTGGLGEGLLLCGVGGGWHIGLGVRLRRGLLGLGARRLLSGGRRRGIGRGDGVGGTSSRGRG